MLPKLISESGISELLVRRPAFHGFEKMLRQVIPHNETRFRIAGELLFYAEKSPRQTPEERAGLHTELEGILGKQDAARVILQAQTVYKMYRFTRNATKLLWLILLLLGTWLMSGLLLGWGWNTFVSLLVAAFLTGVILEIGKWLVIYFGLKN